MRLVRFPYLFLALFAFNVGVGAAPLPASWQPALREIERKLDAAWSRHELGGVSVGVVSGEALIHTLCRGFSDVEKKTPATPRTIYRTASITKQFTALALALAEKDGKLRYSDPLLRWLPEARAVEGLPDNGSPITLLQLATHTSGLPRWAGTRVERAGPLETWPDDLLRALPRTRMIHEPGTHFSYSNIAFALLGEAVARAAGRPFVDLVEQRILAPLQMTSSGFQLNEEQRGRLAVGYQLRDDGSVRTVSGLPESDGRYLIPSGSLYSSVEDLARFISFQLGYGPEQPLTREERRDFYGRLYSARGALSYGYGLGISSSYRNGLLIRGHSGTIAGYTGASFFAPRLNLGAVVLHNGSGDFEPPALARAILEELAEVVETGGR